MRILEPDTGKDHEYIIKSHLFVRITDYGKKNLLKEIIVSPGQHSWEWISFDSQTPIDISDIGDRYSSFDNAINRSVNNIYCTVYEFDDFDDLRKNWRKVIFVDRVKTKYCGED